MENAPADNDVVRLNVGGTVMMTFRSTLMLAPHDSLLSRMFHPDADSRWRPRQLQDGSFFLDCDPAHFGVVLNCLRHGNNYSVVEQLDPATLWGVSALADFFGLTSLGFECQRRQMPADNRFEVLLVSEETVAKWEDSFDLFDRATPDAVVPALREWTLRAIAPLLAQALDAPLDDLLFYPCCGRKNKTQRPSVFVDLLAYDRQLRSQWGSGNENTTIYVERRAAKKSSGQQLVPLWPPAMSWRADKPPKGPVLIFVKVFDPANVKLSGARSFAVDTSASLESVLPDLCKRMRVPAAKVTAVYEEIRPTQVEEVRLQQTLTEAELDFGDILWLVKGTAPKKEAMSKVLTRLRRPAHLQEEPTKRRS